MSEQLKPLKFAAIVNAFIHHPHVDPGPEIGLLDPVSGIPSDFSGAFLCNKQPTHIHFQYYILEEEYEVLEIKQEIELPGAIVALDCVNGCEHVGFSYNKEVGTINASFEGTRLLKFVVDVDGKIFTFERDLSHQNGIAPIFIQS